MDARLSWFLRWKGRGFPVVHRLTQVTYYIPSGDVVILAPDGMLPVATSPDGPTNAKERVVEVVCLPINEVDIDI